MSKEERLAKRKARHELKGVREFPPVLLELLKQLAFLLIKILINKSK